MKTFVLDVLTPEDEEMVVTILEGLRKGHAISFHPVAPELPLPELHDQIQAALDSPRLTWEQGLKELGL
ncbi:hypothetical protein [Hymenobacter sp. PAMC 26628]|uniref:hypothetical protein n=1 Tax=Hymenobacter sp. PAMC 26628 TaxID=1484118 RepID=UPI00077022A7|nr:hypothetical protein [Hymenobacter sp. PAMC 26628]AMJ64138.1 hypothetical protein AXW84_00825 [Hymenobacter sp. PAMC 26628]